MTPERLAQLRASHSPYDGGEFFEVLDEVDRLQTQLAFLTSFDEILHARGWEWRGGHDLPTRAQWDNATAVIDLIAEAIGLPMEGPDGTLIEAARALHDEVETLRAQRKGDPIPGAEAEELRSKMEQLAEALGDGPIAFELQKLLDGVDARDSLAWLEERKADKALLEQLEARAKTAEAELQRLRAARAQTFSDRPPAADVERLRDISERRHRHMRRLEAELADVDIHLQGMDDTTDEPLTPDQRRAIFDQAILRLADVVAAAGELLVPIPEPGTDMARLLLANIAMRRERDEARKEQAIAVDAFHRCRAERDAEMSRPRAEDRHFVFTALPGPGSECVFVEVENALGVGVRCGEWRMRSDGHAELYVRGGLWGDIAELEKRVAELEGVEALARRAVDLYIKERPPLGAETSEQARERIAAHLHYMVGPTFEINAITPTTEDGTVDGYTVEWTWTPGFVALPPGGAPFLPPETCDPRGTGCAAEPDAQEPK